MKGGDTCTLTPRTRAEFQKEWQALQKILEETLEKKLEVERAFEFYYRYCFNNPQNLSNERAIIVGQFAKAYGIALPQAEGLFDALQNDKRCKDNYIKVYLNGNPVINVQHECECF